MKVSTQSFYVPKRGNAQEEYEDAFFPDGFSGTVSAFRCAVADGASESAFANIWAELLVRGFGHRRLNVAELRNHWKQEVKGRPLPWFLEKKVGRGAFAAFIGLSLRDPTGGREKARKAEKVLTAADWMPSNEVGGKGSAGEPSGNGWHTDEDLARKAKCAGTWRAIAVGDSCLFHVRDDELVTVGPVCKSDQFDNSPYLLGSNSSGAIRRGADHVSVHCGTWSKRDLFYLATDAMSQWLLYRVESGLAPWEMLRELGADDTLPFDELVAEMRSEHDLHNDDTTLLRVEVA